MNTTELIGETLGGSAPEGQSCKPFTINTPNPAPLNLTLNSGSVEMTPSNNPSGAQVTSFEVGASSSGGRVGFSSSARSIPDKGSTVLKSHNYANA